MGYSTGKFSEIGSFLKMDITQKFELGISSNFLHSIRTSMCIRKCNKNWRKSEDACPGLYFIIYNMMVMTHFK